MNPLQNGTCVWEIQNEEGLHTEAVHCRELNTEAFSNLEDSEIKDIV